MFRHVSICRAGALSVLLTAAASAAAGESLAERYTALAVQGDLTAAAALFTAGSVASPDAAELGQQFRRRFVDDSETPARSSGDDLVDRVIAAYQRYWTGSLMKKVSPEARLQGLEAALSAIHGGADAGPGKPLDLFALSSAAIARRGFHSLSDHTPPWRNFLLWKKQEEVPYTVQLTDTRRELRVVFMDEFYSEGWTHFASLGLISASGWASADKLYCVAWAYDRDSENFRVSYLKHEARHLVDYERFPELDRAELEYRAKLTELAFASATLNRLLEQFTRNAAPNPAAPHAFANHRVTRDLYEALHGETFPENGNPWLHLSAGRVNPVARDLLRRHSQAMTTAGTSP